MPAPNQVSILKRDGSRTPYFTYADARTASVAGDLIQIKADLNEQIMLKNGVDIWLIPGVVINSGSSQTKRI